MEIFGTAVPKISIFKLYGKYCKRQRLYDSKIMPNVQQNSVPIV